MTNTFLNFWTKPLVLTGALVVFGLASGCARGWDVPPSYYGPPAPVYVPAAPVYVYPPPHPRHHRAVIVPVPVPVPGPGPVPAPVPVQPAWGPRPVFPAPAVVSPARQRPQPRPVVAPGYRR